MPRPMMSGSWPVTLLTAAVATGAVPAAADERLAIRHMGETTATSTCIGNPVTPMCAIDTVLACNVRKQLNLCEAVGLGMLRPPDRKYTVDYYVVRVHVLRPEDIKEEFRGYEWHRPGLIKIMTMTRACTPDDVPCEKVGWREQHYTIDKAQKGWRIISLYGDDPN